MNEYEAEQIKKKKEQKRKKEKVVCYWSRTFRCVVATTFEIHISQTCWP